MSADERPFDVEIGASAQAKRVRFKRVPETDVRFVGSGEERSERDNLPEDVEPGVTYRDVRVRWRAGARVESDTEAPRKES